MHRKSIKHSWQLEANANIQTKGDVLNFRILSPSYNISFVVQKSKYKGTGAGKAEQQRMSNSN